MPCNLRFKGLDFTFPENFVSHLLFLCPAFIYDSLHGLSSLPSETLPTHLQAENPRSTSHHAIVISTSIGHVSRRIRRTACLPLPTRPPFLHPKPPKLSKVETSDLQGPRDQHLHCACGFAHLPQLLLEATGGTRSARLHQTMGPHPTPPGLSV